MLHGCRPARCVALLRPAACVPGVAVQRHASGSDVAAIPAVRGRDAPRESCFPAALPLALLRARGLPQRRVHAPRESFFPVGRTWKRPRPADGRGRTPAVPRLGRMSWFEGRGLNRLVPPAYVTGRKPNLHAVCLWRRRRPWGPPHPTPASLLARSMAWRVPPGHPRQERHGGTQCRGCHRESPKRERLPAGRRRGDPGWRARGWRAGIAGLAGRRLAGARSLASGRIR